MKITHYIIYVLITWFSLESSLYSQNLLSVPDSLKKDLKIYFAKPVTLDSESSSSGGMQIDESLYSSFRVPEFGYKEFRIGSDKLFNFTSVGKQSTLAANFEGDYKVFNQTLYSTVDYSIKPFYDFIKEKDSDVFTAVQLQVPFDISKFFNNDYTGVQAFSDGAFSVSKLGEADLLNPLDLTVGVGYGRVTSVRPIARAVALATEIGGDVTNEDIINIANIITRNNDGFYTKKYKSEAKIYYYTELADALNAPNKTMKIQQVMEDPAFSNISDRKSGWQLRLGLKNTYLLKETSDANLVASADYAKPLGLDKQFIVGLDLVKQGESDLETEVKAALSVDHAITWVSNAKLTYNSMSTDIEISTTKELINKISGRMSLNFTMPDGGDLGTEFNVKLIYFAF